MATGFLMVGGTENATKELKMEDSMTYVTAGNVEFVADKSRNKMCLLLTLYSPMVIICTACFNVYSHNVSMSSA
jgi:hypothetical protein